MLWEGRRGLRGTSPRGTTRSHGGRGLRSLGEYKREFSRQDYEKSTGFRDVDWCGSSSNSKKKPFARELSRAIESSWRVQSSEKEQDNWKSQICIEASQGSMKSPMTT